MNGSNGIPTEVSRETAEVLQFALDMAEQTKGALEPTIFPIITAWGFINGEYRISAKNELAGLLQYTDYEKVVLKENFVILPDGNAVSSQTHSAEIYLDLQCVRGSIT